LSKCNPERQSRNGGGGEWGTASPPRPTGTGREAKFYDLTSKGRTHLKQETENWTRLTGVVTLILEKTLEGIG
jgi:hypothetical protein